MLIVDHIAIIFLWTKIFCPILGLLHPHFPHPLPPPSFQKRRETKFWLPPLEGRVIWKITKGCGSMVKEQVFLKVGCVAFSCLIFLRLTIFTFRNYFTLCKTVLYIWRKIIFFSQHNFMRKGHSKLPKIEHENIP